MKLTLFRQFFLILFIATLAFVYLSCDDAGVELQTQQFCISGQIAGWTSGSNKSLYAYVYGESHHIYSFANCPIDAQGNFNLCLPSLSDTTLLPADSIFFSGCNGGNVTFNPPDGKGAEIYNFKVKSGDTVIGGLIRKNYDTLYPGAFSVNYIYSNKSIAVSGYKYCSPDTLNFNGTSNNGWTKIVKNCTRTQGTGTTYLDNTMEPSGAIWKYTIY